MAGAFMELIIPVSEAGSESSHLYIGEKCIKAWHPV